MALNKKRLSSAVNEALRGFPYCPDIGGSPAYSIVMTIVDTIKDALQRGEEVRIPGFGIFTFYTSPPTREGRSTFSRDGKLINRYVESLPAKKRVIFKPSKRLMELINDNRHPSREENS